MNTNNYLFPCRIGMSEAVVEGVEGGSGTADEVPDDKGADEDTSCGIAARVARVDHYACELRDIAEVRHHAAELGRHSDDYPVCPFRYRRLSHHLPLARPVNAVWFKRIAEIFSVDVECTVGAFLIEFGSY